MALLDTNGVYGAPRFFTAAKRAEFAYGGTTLQARTVGRALAAEPV